MKKKICPPPPKKTPRSEITEIKSFPLFNTVFLRGGGIIIILKKCIFLYRTKVALLCVPQKNLSEGNGKVNSTPFLAYMKYAATKEEKCVCVVMLEGI